ncbi:MAG: sel1 repeat family protein [Alphaproteobacteria bacterium]|nr:sel1 repeat family protein [Alphaproteobacteria bacterium]
MMRAIAAGLVLALLFAGSAGAQNLESGLAAYKRGAYGAALRQLLPLARGGDPVAQSTVGVMYHNGLGVKADLSTAVDWYARAAKSGDSLAQRILGDLYVQGVGGAPDYVAAAEWYEAAAEGGDGEAQRKLNALRRGGGSSALDAGGGASGRGGSRGAAGGSRAVEISRLRRRGAGRATRKGSLRRPGSCMSGMPNAPFQVDVKIDFPPVNFSHSQSIADLGKISGRGHHRRILGLMKPDIRLRTLPMSEGMSQGGKYCFWITGFEIVLRYAQVDVYVAREYPVGSCQYDAIYAHEMEHVEVARRNLETFAPRIREALELGSVPTAQTPIIVASAADATRDIQAISKENLQPVYRAMLRDLQAAQARVDSPQSYASVFRKCPKW